MATRELVMVSLVLKWTLASASTEGLTHHHTHYGTGSHAEIDQERECLHQMFQHTPVSSLSLLPVEKLYRLSTTGKDCQ